MVILLQLLLRQIDLGCCQSRHEELQSSATYLLSHTTCLLQRKAKQAFDDFVGATDAVAIDLSMAAIAATVDTFAEIIVIQHPSVSDLVMHHVPIEARELFAVADELQRF